MKADKMKSLMICLVIFLLFFSSCKKDEDKRQSVYAGVYNSTMTDHEFNPPLQLTLTRDTLRNTSYGEDSLDINLDGNYDLMISQRLLLGNPPENTNPNDTYPFCKLSMKKGVEVAIQKETYYIGLGQTSSVNWVDTLAYKAPLENLTEWTNTNTCWMWVVPPAIFWGSNGTWYNLSNAEKYIAVRMNANSHYQYGWIKVKVISRENISIISYALEK